MVIKNTTGAFIELFDIMSPNTEEVAGGLFTYNIKGIDAAGIIDLSDYNAPSAEFNSREIEEQISAGNIVIVDEGIDLNLSDSLEYFKTFGVSEAGFESSDITGKTQITPTSGDFLILTDGSDSDNLKKVNAADFLGGGGGSIPTLRNVSSTDTFATNQETINCTSGSFTINLPTAVGIQGTVFTLVNSGTGIIRLAANGTETINSSFTVDLETQISRTVQSDNANWIII